MVCIGTLISQPAGKLKTLTQNITGNCSPLDCSMCIQGQYTYMVYKLMCTLYITSQCSTRSNCPRSKCPRSKCLRSKYHHDKPILTQTRTLTLKPDPSPNPQPNFNQNLNYLYPGHSVVEHFVWSPPVHIGVYTNFTKKIY